MCTQAMSNKQHAAEGTGDWSPLSWPWPWIVCLPTIWPVSKRQATLIDDRCLDQVPGRDIASTKSAICADG